MVCKPPPLSGEKVLSLHWTSENLYMRYMGGKEGGIEIGGERERERERESERVRVRERQRDSQFIVVH